MTRTGHTDGTRAGEQTPAAAPVYPIPDTGFT